MQPVHDIPAAEQRCRPRRRGRPSLIAAALVAVLSMALAGPALAAEPPSVSAVQPHEGPPAGGTTVTLTGTNFTGATAVEFGSTSAESFEVISASKVTVFSNTELSTVAPPGNGTVDVRVANEEGESPLTPVDQFTYVEAPTVTKIEPTSGPASGGTAVTITGTNFVGVTNVSFGSNNAPAYKVNSATSITVEAPAGSGRADVTVTTPSGTSATSEADRFSYVPSVIKVEPNHGSTSGGTTVTITGTGFSGATAVKFGTTSSKSFTVNSATSITAVSPRMKAGGTVDVTVTTPGGATATSPADQFTFSKK